MFTKHPIPSRLLLWHQNWTRSYFGLWNTILYWQVPFLKWKKFFGPENNQSTEVDRFLSIVLWTTWISCCCSAFAFGLLSLEQCRAIKIFFFRARWWVSVTMKQWPQVSTCGGQSSSQKMEEKKEVLLEWDSVINEYLNPRNMNFLVYKLQVCGCSLNCKSVYGHF